MTGLTASEDIAKSAQYTRVNEFITSDAVELGSAIDKFCEPAEDRFQSTQDSGAVEEELTTSWKSIIATAAETSFTDAGMQKLVDFVLELQSRPDLEKDGKACIVQGMTVWKDLPTFGWQMRDAWNFAATDKDEESKQQQWISLNAWTASVVAAAHSNAGDKPDLSLYGIWTVRSALEESQAPSDPAIAAAAVWFVFAAPALYEFSEQGKDFDGKVAAPGSALKDQQWRGYTQERWQAWGRKLNEYASQVSDNVTKQLVKQAGEAYEKAK